MKSRARAYHAPKKRSNPESNTSFNEALRSQLCTLVALYHAGKIQEQLQKAMQLVENFFLNQFNQLPIPEHQMQHLDHIIKRIKENTPTNDPLAQLVHAVFLTRKGADYEKAALQAFDQIHTSYPDYLPAYKRHLLFCTLIKNHKKMTRLQNIVINLEAPKVYLKELFPGSERILPATPKQTTPTFNRAVGSRPSIAMLFSAQPATSEQLEISKLLTMNCS